MFEVTQIRKISPKKVENSLKRLFKKPSSFFRKFIHFWENHETPEWTLGVQQVK